MHKDDLLKPRLPEADVETVAGIVRVRGLSRSEVLKLQHSVEDVDTLDQRMFEMALLEPQLTQAEIKAWRNAWTQGEIDVISDKIAELSGMKDTEEERERSFRAGAV